MMVADSGANTMRAIKGSWRTSRGSVLAIGACACTLMLGLTGCVFTTPSRSEVEPARVEASLGATDLVNAGYLTVAMDTSDAPQALTDSDGLPTGYYADVARALAERLGLDLKVVSAANAQGALDDGEADLFLGASLLDADEELEVTDAVVEDASSLFTRNSDGSLESPTIDVDGVSGAKIAVQKDSAAQDALARGGVEGIIKPCSNVNECFEALESGEAEYVACDATAGAYLARAYPGAVFVATIGSPSSYGIALPAGDSVLSDAVEAAFAELLKDGTLEAIHRSWYGSLPFGLAGEQLAGLTLASNADDAGGSEESDSAGDLTIAGDLNSIG